jgi:hypothetical protein
VFITADVQNATLVYVPPALQAGDFASPQTAQLVNW